MEQERAIWHVLDAYNSAVGSSYAVTRRPDAENRDSADIDAYAESAALQPLAIEHTKIQSLEDQNRDSAWFMRALGALQTELSGVFPFRLVLVFPYRNVEPGQDWSSVCATIKHWLVAHAASLPEGRTTHHLAGVPFPVITSKRTSVNRKVFLVRQEPPGDPEALLLAQMHESLGHKYDKLGQYRQQGAAAVLVLESEDIALVSEQSLYKAFLRATREHPRPNLDHVWLAFDYSVYCFLGPHDVMAGVNPENFRFGPEFAAEWLPDVME